MFDGECATTWMMSFCYAYLPYIQGIKSCSTLGGISF